MVQGYDPNNPNPWGQQQQQQQQQGVPAEPALGFDSAPKQEKYNTQYLASSIQKQRRTGQYVVIGAIGAIVIGIIVAMVTQDDKPPPKPVPATAGALGAPPAAPAAEATTDAK